MRSPGLQRPVESHIRAPLGPSIRLGFWRAVTRYPKARKQICYGEVPAQFILVLAFSHGLPDIHSTALVQNPIQVYHQCLLVLPSALCCSVLVTELVMYV